MKKPSILVVALTTLSLFCAWSPAYTEPHPSVDAGRADDAGKADTVDAGHDFGAGRSKSVKTAVKTAVKAAVKAADVSADSNDKASAADLGLAGRFVGLAGRFGLAPNTAQVVRFPSGTVQAVSGTLAAGTITFTGSDKDAVFNTTTDANGRSVMRAASSNVKTSRTLPGSRAAREALRKGDVVVFTSASGSHEHTHFLAVLATGKDKNESVVVANIPSLVQVGSFHAISNPAFAIPAAQRAVFAVSPGRRQAYYSLVAMAPVFKEAGLALTAGDLAKLAPPIAQGKTVVANSGTVTVTFTLADNAFITGSPNTTTRTRCLITTIASKKLSHDQLVDDVNKMYSTGNQWTAVSVAPLPVGVYSSASQQQ